MKKRYFIFNIVLLISALVVFLIVSVSVVSSINRKNMESEIKSYLEIVDKSYDGTNMEYSASLIHTANSDLRVTFISNTGKVLYDTSEVSEENHLTRPEISDLGAVYYRYSDTTKIRMLYIASYQSQYSIYIRVSMPESSVKGISNTLIGVGCGTIAIISIISFFVMAYLSKKSIEPLKKQIDRFSTIVNDDANYEGSDLERLSYQVDKARFLIEEKILTIEHEKMKINYIIENIPQGLIVVDAKGNVILTNKKALSVLNKKYDDVINKSYLYAFLNKDVVDAISKSIESDAKSNISIDKANASYVINISSLDADFVREEEKYGVSVFIYDVTESKKLMKIKTDFFANASHELKSPLTSIIGYQQMISEGILTEPEEITDATKKTVKEANRMNQIITEMLELSKLESKTTSEPVNTDLAKACEEILDSLTSAAQEKKIKIIKEYEELSVFMPQSDLYHLIRNLIDNAIKYNKVEGELRVSISKEGKTLTVSDTGIGIAKENISRIYERFYRVDKAKSKEIGGTGLGLAIVKHICMNNNLKIDVESIINVGTKFIVHFN